MTTAAVPVLQGPQTLVDFFHLLEQPFGVTPDPAYLYLGPTHHEALSSLADGIRADRGFLALIAEPGMGKTTLLHRLMEDLADSARVVFLFQTQCDIRQFFQYVLAELGVNAEGMGLVAMHRQLNEILFNEMLAGRRFVLIVDESQNLRDTVLETLRMLSNFETPYAKLLQIVLAGQPQLAAKLAQPSFKQLRQRLAVVSHLVPLSAFETARYVEHRLSVAGHRGGALFTRDALILLEKASRGIPRDINTICFDAMQTAFRRWQTVITPEIIAEAVSSKQIDTVCGQPSAIKKPVAAVSPPIGLRLGYEPPIRFRSWRRLFRRAPQSRRNVTGSSPNRSAEELTDSRTRREVSTDFRFQPRSFQMTNTGVARATILGPLSKEPPESVEAPVVEPGDAARAEISVAPREDALRLAARIQALATEADRVFLFAGVTATDGVGEVAAGVASALAQMGKARVLLVDADLRVPSLHERFGVQLSPGLSELNAKTMNGKGLHPLGTGGVTLLTAGEKTDPLSLFSSPGFSSILHKFREEYRFIVLKAPAILSSAEVDILVRSMDGVVMVIPNGRQRKPAVAEAGKALADLRAKVMGVVLCEEAPRGRAGVEQAG
ncbi:MAG: AAA family ATPase [Candidatus Acidiferrum sp.]